MSEYFIALKPIPDSMTITDIAAVLKKYIDAQFPGNNMVRWTVDPAHANIRIDSFSGKRDYHYVDCDSKRNDHDEDVLDLRLFLNSGPSQRLALITSHGDAKENFAVARALRDVVESIVRYKEQPIIGEFAEALLSKHDANYASLKEKPIQFVHDDSTLEVLIDDVAVAAYDFADEGREARFRIKSYLADWNRLANNLGMQASPTKKEEHEIESPRI